MADAFRNRSPLLPEVLGLHGRWRASEIAVEDASGSLDWAGLIARSNQVAHGLAALGLGPGDRVAVLMSNRMATVEVLVGLMRAGMTAVPLNPGCTDDSLAAMVADAGAQAVFLTPEHRDRLPGAGFTDGGVLVAGEGYEAWRDAQVSDDPGVRIQPDWVCNLIYSSGTTGLPKGIAHTYAQRTFWAHDLALALRYRSGCRTLLMVGLHSNISWVGMLCSYLVGGRLILEPAFDPARFFERARERSVTHTSMVPVMYQRLLDQWPADPASHASLEAVMCCGSPLPAGAKSALLEKLGGKLIELYGSTEGVITTLDPEDAPGRLTSVGKPTPGSDLRILDAEDRPVPPGEAGEIVGRSRYAMDGYWNRPEATAEATWVDEAGSPWLRSGDIGRLDEEGFLYLVDRKKDMILSGGQNVYPADMEAELYAHPAVAECAVVGAPSRRWGETPVAFVVLRGGHAVTGEELKAWLNARVARFQRVAEVRLVGHLPRNATGKVLKRQLREGLPIVD